jgi:DNA-binding Lrp family transcriptional regulator
LNKSRIHSVDHKILERTAAAPVDLDLDDHEADFLNIDELEPFLSLIPPREVDLIDMYCRKKKKQKEIATFFSISQGAVSHRLTRAKKRLIFLRDMPKIEDRDLKTQLKEVFPAMDADIVFYMIRTTCQSKTAQMVNQRYRNSNLTQVKVRHKFHRAVIALSSAAQDDPRFEITATLAKYILDKGLYMLHEVKLPHFDKGAEAQIDMANFF